MAGGYPDHRERVASARLHHASRGTLAASARRLDRRNQPKRGGACLVEGLGICAFRTPLYVVRPTVVILSKKRTRDFLANDPDSYPADSDLSSEKVLVL